MRSYRYFHLDVFTDRLFGGNQLAVFLDARGLSAAEMQSIAREMNFSETTFVTPSGPPIPEGCDCTVRIFTPHRELPMAGHPVIGTAFAMARAGLVPPARDRVTFSLGIGPTPVALTWLDRALTFAWMTQPAPSFSPLIPHTEGAAAILRLPPSVVADTGLPVQVVSCGLPVLLVPVATRRAVDDAALDPDAFAAFREAASIDEAQVFVFSTEPGPEQATAYSRCFAPDFGISEDPATGNATGPLGSYLVHHKVVPAARAGSMWSLQGVKMGRPSHVHVAVGAAHGQITDVRVGGESIVAGEGTLYV